MHQSSDVLVIGGGAIGLCSAYFLARDGARVTVLEQREIGAGSSLHNAGLVVPSHFIPLAHPGVIRQGLRWMMDPESPFYIKPRLSPDLLRWILLFRKSSTAAHVSRSMRLLRDLHQASFGLYEMIARDEEVDFELVKHGCLLLFRTERGMHGCMHEAELAREVGVEAAMLTPGEIRTLDPGLHSMATGGLFFPDDGHLNPARFLEQMVKILVRNGVEIVTGTRVLGFEQEGRRIGVVHTSTGSHGAEDIVLAGGAWSAPIVRDLGLRLPLQAGKGYSITVPRPPGTPAMPLILTEARVAVTPFGDSLRFAGTMEIAGLDTSITGRRVQAILKAVPRYLDMDVSRPSAKSQIWAGLRPCSPDGLPYIGRFTSVPNLIAATGHAMIGTSLAPITGSLVADLHAGRTPALPLHQLRPDRFFRQASQEMMHTS